MDNLYTSMEAIPTSHTGIGARLRFSSMLCLMQDAASVHAERLGLGFDYLSGVKRAFILSRMQLKVCSELPVWGERVILQTWPRGVEKLFAYRDFELSREGREPFLKASSSWFLIDTEQRHPVRQQEYFVNITPRDVHALPPEAPLRMRWEENVTAFDIRRARANDLDLNGHVNNTRYVDWITDAIAERYGVETQIEELCINFLAEVRMGEEVRIGLSEGTNGNIVIQGETEKHSFVSHVRLRLP